MTTRQRFGGDLPAWLFTLGTGNVAVLAASTSVKFFNAQTGGSQYTDLASDAGGTVTFDHVTSGDGSAWPLGVIPQFYGPVGVYAMWADAGGTRLLIVCNDLGDTVGATVFTTAAALSAHAAAINPHNTGLAALVDVSVPAAGSRTDGTLLSWVAPDQKFELVSPAAASGTVLLNPPLVGGSYVGNTAVAPLSSQGSGGNPWLTLQQPYSSGDTNPDALQFFSTTSTGLTKIKTSWWNGNCEFRGAPSVPNRIGFRVFEMFESIGLGPSTGRFFELSTNPTNTANREPLLGAYGTGAAGKPGWIEATRILSALLGVAAGGSYNSLTQVIFRGRRATSGAPTSGAWSAGDVILDSTGAVYLCTVSGTPGTWSTASGGGGSTFASGATFGGGYNSLSAFTLRGLTGSAGAPTSGTWAAGDVVLDAGGVLYLCTAGGAPGTWVGGGGGGGGTNEAGPTTFTDITPGTSMGHGTKHAATRLDRGGDNGRLRGTLTASGAVTSGATIATIPTTTHRPLTTVNSIVRTSASGTQITIDTAGVISIGASLSAGNSVWLDGITWDMT